MRLLRRSFTLSICLTVSLSAFAAPDFLQMGRLGGTATAGDNAVAPVRTHVDVSHPASATGMLTNVRFNWSQAGCGNDVTIKVFRRFGDILQQIAATPLLTPAPGVNAITLSQPISVIQGDLIGITRLTVCGNPQTDTSLESLGIPDQGYLTFGFDTTTNATYSINDAAHSGVPLLLGGEGAVSEYLALVIPVVGSTRGAFGSYFRTGIQVTNGPCCASEIKLVFRPVQTSSPINNPTVVLPVGGDSAAVVAVPDILESLFGTTGIGSIDVLMSAFRDPPVIVTRIYNDAGALGMPGVEEPAIEPRVAGLGSSVLDFSDIGVLVTPSDMGRMRFNIGVRSLFSGVNFDAMLIDAAGTPITTISRSYPPNWFEQVDASTYFGVPIGSNQSIRVTVQSGSAIVYGSTVDNATNAPSFQLMRTVDQIGIR